MKLRNILVLTLLAVGISYAQADDREIRYEQLPAKAKTTITKNAPKQKVYIVTQDDDFNGGYEVEFQEGEKIEFDKNGNWKDVDFRNSAVPASFVPANIQKYVTAKYRGQKIVKIEKNRNGYEVELSRGTELVFDRNGKFIRVDR